MSVMGDRKRRVRFDNEIEPTERRRSSRIIALEERRREEQERKKALALERKNKAKIDSVYYELSDSSDEDDEEQDGRNQKGCRGEALHQPNKDSSPVQEGQQAHNRRASRIIARSSIPTNDIIKKIIGELESHDPDDLFAMPASIVNRGEKENSVIKQPMDFATMLTKMYDGSYTSFDLIKRDALLMCNNAMLINPDENSRHHKVAKTIIAHANSLFERIRVEPEPQHCDLKLSLSNRSPSRKQHDSQPRTSRNARAPPKPAGRKNVEVSDAEKRDTYLSVTPSSNPSIVTEFLQVSKPDILLIQDASKYKESLLNFVEGLGPAAKRVVARKIKALDFQPLTNNNIDSSASPSLNSPLPTQENTSVNTNAVVGANITDAAYLAKTIANWNAFAAALLANSFLRNENVIGRSNNSGCESSNARSGTLDIGNVIPIPIPFQEGSSRNHEQQLQAPNAINGSTTRTVSTLVLPTIVIPRAESIAGSSGGSRPSMTQQIRPQSMPSINLLGAPTMPHNQQILTHSIPMRNNNNNNHGMQNVVMPQHVAPHFANEPNTSLYSLATPCEPGNFQALLGTIDLNNSPYPMQQNQQRQVMLQHPPYASLAAATNQSFHPRLPMRVLNQMNLQAPSVYLQQQMASSSTPQAPFGSAIVGGSAASTGQKGEASTTQPGCDNEEQPNLSLRL